MDVIKAEEKLRSFYRFLNVADVLTEQQMSLYISNLINIAPCLFIPSQ